MQKQKPSSDIHYDGWYYSTKQNTILVILWYNGYQGKYHHSHLIRIISGLRSGYTLKTIKYQIMMNIFHYQFYVEMREWKFSEYNKNTSIDGKMLYILDDD